MTDDEDLAQIHVKVPRADKEQFQAVHGHGALTEHIRDLVAREAWGEDVSARLRAERRLDAIEKELGDLRDRRDELDQEIDALRTERDQVEERLDQLDSREDAYEDALEACSKVLRDAKRLFPGHGKLQAAARAGGVEQEDVIEELKERHPSVPDHAFVEWRKDPRPFNGIS